MLIEQYRYHAVAAVVIVAFPISIYLSKCAVVAVQNYVDKSMSLIIPIELAQKKRG